MFRLRYRLRLLVIIISVTFLCFILDTRDAFLEAHLVYYATLRNGSSPNFCHTHLYRRWLGLATVRTGFLHCHPGQTYTSTVAHRRSGVMVTPVAGH